MNSRTALLSALILLAAIASHAETVTVGRVYPIVERDALDEIEDRARSADLKAHVNTDPDAWRASASLALPPAPETVVRSHAPWYTLEMDIPDAAGRIIYPKGYRFNPLEFAHLPNDIVVISEQEAMWAKSKITSRSLVILTDGDRVKVSKQLKKVVYLLDAKTRDRLALRYVPSIVKQKGAALEISEYRVESDR